MTLPEGPSSTSPLTTTMRLPDGRTLEYSMAGCTAEGAVPSGATVLVFHHGTPGSSHLESSLIDACAARAIVLVQASRAGYSVSSRLPGRDVAAVAADTAALLDHLGVASCLIAGASGGGPHALACSALLGSRVRATASIAGVAPHDATGLDFLAGMGQDNWDEFGAAALGEQALLAYLEPQRHGLLAATTEQIMDQLASLLPPVDIAQMDGITGADIAASFSQGLAHGVYGWLDDDLAFTRPWGFPLAEVPAVAIWQGGDDLMVPAAHGAWLVQHLAQARAFLLPGEGHLSIGCGHAGQMLDDLLAHT